MRPLGQPGQAVEVTGGVTVLLPGFSLLLFYNFGYRTVPCKSKDASITAGISFVERALVVTLGL